MLLCENDIDLYFTLSGIFEKFYGMTGSIFGSGCFLCSSLEWHFVQGRKFMCLVRNFLHRTSTGFCWIAKWLGYNHIIIRQ
jgi:hypothetical protein